MGSVNGSYKKFSYLDMLSTIGMAKHIGGRYATDELLKDSGIKKGSRVLDVGCGIGRTSCRLAKELECTVIWIDIMPRMIELSRARARSMKVDDRAMFFRADARNLPVKAEMFDTVLVESVTIFVEDVDKALNEYRRVARANGMVCENEVCITRKSHEELKDDLDDMESVLNAFSSKTDRGFMTYEDWKETLESIYGSVESKHYILDPRVEMEAKREDGINAIIGQLRTIWLFMTNPEARSIIEEGRKMMKYTGHFGYGLFVCKK